MAELKITPIVPVDEDDVPARKKRAPAAPRKPREPGERATASSRAADNEPVIDPSEPEFDPQAVEDEVKRRYGIDAKLKVVEVKRSRSGVKSMKTGASRR